MGTLAEQFAAVFRDYVTDGVPASGEHEPVKSEVRAIGPAIETALGVGVLGGVDVTYATRAELNADLAHDAGATALVYADATDANNDLYVKTGASGSGAWTLTTILHDVIGASAQPALDAAEGFAVLAGHYANDDTDTDVPGGVVGDRGAKFYRNSARDARDEAQGYAESIAVSSIAARITIMENLLNLPHTPLSAPEFRDDFDVDGNLNGRAGWTVETRPGFSSQVNAISASGGKAGGTTGSAAFALHAASVEDVRVTVKIGALGTWLYHFANIDATDANRDWLNIGMAQAVSSGLNSGLISLNKVVNASGQTTVSNVAGVRPEVGDVFASEFTTVGAVRYWTPYLNGRQAGAAVDITSWGGAFSVKKHGLIGNVGAAVCDSIQVADGATQQLLRLFQPNRTVPLNSDGSVTWRLSLTYSKAAPLFLFASVYDLSVSAVTPIAGLDRVKLSSFTSGGGTAYGEVTATAAQIASGGPFMVRVVDPSCVTSLGALADSISEGPKQTPGYVIGGGGQSLATAMLTQTSTTDVFAAPADTWWVDAAPTNVSTLGNPWDRKQLPITSNTTVAAFAKAFNDASGKKCTVLRGGVGGTAIALRTVGTASHNALIEGLGHAGGKFHLVQWADGQSDVTTAPATYTATIQAIMDDLATRNGGATVQCLMHPVSGAWNTAGGNDENWQTMRRTQWKLTQDYPTRYLLGAFSCDIQQADNLHKTANGYGEYMRRAGWAAARALGLTANSRNGPSLYSVQRIDAQTIYCVYDLNGFDSLTMLNSAYAGEHHGGMLFSTSSANNGSTITAKVWPTGHTVDAAPSGGRQGVTFTFTAGSFPASVYAWASYGKDPFNPNNLAAVQTDMAGKANMIVGVKAGEPNVALRPRFAVDAQDWISAA